MSEEEVIKIFKSEIARFKDLEYHIETDTLYEWIDNGEVKTKIKCWETLLDLYNKQKETIKELEEDNKHQWEERCKMAIELDNDVIPKSKIKEKIEKYQKEINKLENKKMWNEPIDTIKKNRFVNYYNILQELLEEK